MINSVLLFLFCRLCSALKVHRLAKTTIEEGKIKCFNMWLIQLTRKLISSSSKDTHLDLASGCLKRQSPTTWLRAVDKRQIREELAALLNSKCAAWKTIEGWRNVWHMLSAGAGQTRSNWRQSAGERQHRSVEIRLNMSHCTLLKGHRRRHAWRAGRPYSGPHGHYQCHGHGAIFVVRHQQVGVHCHLQTMLTLKAIQMFPVWMNLEAVV